MQSKADMSQLNSTARKRQLKSGKTEKLISKQPICIGKQSGESVESVLEKKKEGYGGKDLQKREVLSLE